MPRNPDSPQAQWQKQFRQAIKIDVDGLREFYNRWDNPATWWHNPVNYDSLRLTKEAYHAITSTEFPHYKFKLTEKVKPKTFVQLERYFTSPYYILNAQTIVVFGDMEAMMIGLHANNLQQYLDNQDK